MFKRVAAFSILCVCVCVCVCVHACVCAQMHMHACPARCSITNIKFLWHNYGRYSKTSHIT